MAGILDSKTRVIDSVITQEGKRQITNGGLRPVFASVSDRHSFYEYDAVSGSTDASKRLYFESPIESINDSIMMETNDSGKLLGYAVQGPVFYNNAGVVTGRESVSGSLVYATSENFEGFASLATGIITSSIDRIKNLYMIGTRDQGEADDLQMELSKDSYTFTLNNIFPFLDGPTDATSNVDFIEPLFWDKRLSDIDNFRYLPPITDDLTAYEESVLLAKGVPNRKMFGKYVKIDRPNPITLQSLMKHMNMSVSGSSVARDPDAEEDKGSNDSNAPWVKRNKGDYGVTKSRENGSSINLSSYELPRERVSVFFNKTSSTNNIMMQMFELSKTGSTLKKLDVIDFGFVTDDSDTRHPTKRIFFVGKIFINSISLPVFVNLFVIIMD